MIEVHEVNLEKFYDGCKTKSVISDIQVADQTFLKYMLFECLGFFF